MQVEGRIKGFAKRIAPTYWGWAIIALLCYVVGFFLAGLAMFMVWKFGESFGVTEAERYAYGAMHAVLHVGGIATAFCIGGYLNEKRPGRAFVAMLVVMVVGAYGIQNIAGFAAKNRVATSDALAANNKNTWETYLTRQKTLQERIEKTAEVIVDARSYLPAERNEARKLKREYEKQLADLKPPAATAENVTGDASATVLARLTGWSFGIMQASAVVFLAILCFIVEVYIFVQGTDRAARAWGRTPVPEPAVNHKTHPSSGGSPGSGGKSKDGKVVQMPEPAKQPQPLRAEPARTMQLQLPKASSGHRGVFSTDAPTGKLTFDQFIDRVRDNVAHGEPALSTYALAAATGWSQTSVVRHQAKMGGKAKARRHSRRYAGNGGGYHHLAVG